MMRDTRSYYDEFSRNYSRERRHGYFGWVNQMEVEVIQSVMGDRRVLEIGCGTGLILDRVRECAPAWLVGVDLSTGMLADARQAGHDVACGSALLLPFHDKAFDVAYSFKVLPHVPNLQMALAEAARVVVDDGEFYVELYNPLSIKGVWDKVRGASRKVYLRHDTPRSVRAVAPPGYSVHCIAGIRIFGVLASSYEGAWGRIFRALDQWAMYGPLRYLAGYQIYRLKRT